MSATYTPGSTAARDKTRRLIPDNTIAGLTPDGDGVYTLVDYTFSDEALDDLLSDEGGDAYGAAAAALEAMIATGATSAARVSGYGFSIDPTAGYNELWARIRWLRRQSAAGLALVATGGALTNKAVW